MMSSSSSPSPALRLQHHAGRQLTAHEVALQQFFERRDEEHRRQVEKRQRKSSLLAQDFFQESGRNAPLKAAPPSPERTLTKQEQEAQQEELLTQKAGILPSDGPQSRVKDEQLSSRSGSRDVVETTKERKQGKSRYHISEQYARQRQSSQNSTLDSSSSEVNSLDIATSSVGGTSLIGKRSRVTASEIAAVTVEPDQLNPVKFPPHQLLLEKDWSPLLACSDDEADAERLNQQVEDAGGEEGAREFILRDFSLLKNQTLAFKITVPPNSARWAINIGPPDPSGSQQQDEDDEAVDKGISQSEEPCEVWQDILFHFNPRYTRRKEIVQATLQGGLWTFSSRQNDMNKMKESFPTNNITLIIQIRADGFYTSVNGIFLSLFPHRSDVKDFKHLRLQLPITDDNGNPENVIFHKVWWGRRDASDNSDFIGCTKETIDDRLRKTEEMAKHIYIGGLPYTDNIDKLDDLRSFLLHIFDEFGPEPESLELPPGKGFARLRLSSVQNAEAAIATYNRYLVVSEDDPDDEFNLIVAHAR